jgi:hypothetical protein
MHLRTMENGPLKKGKEERRMSKKREGKIQIKIKAKHESNQNK